MVGVGGAIYLCICPSIPPCKMTLSMFLSFSPMLSYLHFFLYFTCLSHFFPVFICLIGCFFFLAHFYILSSYISSGRSKIKLPVPECQNVPLLLRFSCHQTLKPLHSSSLPESTGYCCTPETMPLAWSLSKFLPLSAGTIRSSPLSADESTLGLLETPAHLLAPALLQPGPSKLQN